MDTVNKGMKSFLKDVEVTGLIDNSFLASAAQKYGQKVADDGVQVWRALKKLTSEEARRVISSVKDENGFVAWKQLTENFEKGVDAKIGMALAELSGMVMKPAKTPTETRSLITELENKKKVVEEMTEDDIAPMHYKSILLGILDPMTRQHTASIHGTKDMKKLIQTILEFVNYVQDASGDSPMDGIRSVGEQPTCEGHHGSEGWPSWGHEGQEGQDLPEEGGLRGLGMQCFNCGGFWAIYAEIVVTLGAPLVT